MVAKAPVYNIHGEVVEEIELNDYVFQAPINKDLVHQVVLMQLANRRHGTAQTKTRSQVRGGGRKPWRQKGLGRARVGTIRSPLWRGGGITFGPQARDFSYTMPRKARRAALRSVLSSRLQEGSLRVVEELALAQPRTKSVAEALKNLNSQRALIVTDENDLALYKSTRNIPGVSMKRAKDISVYDVISHKHLILTRAAVPVVEEVLSGV